ncbi:monocarboxylate transporter 13-like isoform X1 [Mya arenaria]|uniref:monocarboxylate transporter 13-like isoform X1 n=1 Tax=Mya arenaria TaxID=6604 RepID=UPI0022DEA805|nr:monocarboxylate transporter 13-like isoform X1 [Mya arenaria]
MRTDMGREGMDGGWAWVVLAAVLCSQILLGGICFSAGIFYFIFEREFDSNPVELSWLCSLPTTMWLISTPVGSLLVNKFGYRICAFSGGLVSALGMTLSCFAPAKYFLFFSHGIVTGFGLGLNYTACFVALNTYFDKYKTFATGLASVGHNIGQIIYAKSIVTLDGQYGWKGMLLIHGGLALNLCVFATVLFPALSTELNQKAIGSNRKKADNLKAFRVFGNASFLCLCISNMFVNTGNGVFFLHLPSFSRTGGFQEKDFSLLWTAYGIATIIGKVVNSILGQHPRVNAVFVYFFSLMLVGISMTLLPLFLNKVGLLVLSACVGYFLSVTGALMSAVVFAIVGYEHFADGIGMSMPFKAFGNLMGGPLGGVLYNLTGTYSSSFYLAGASSVIASLLMIHPIVCRRRNTMQKKRGLSEIIAEQEVFQVERKQTFLCDDKYTPSYKEDNADM